MSKKIEVTKDPENDVPFEVLEASIVEISDTMYKLSKTRVTNKLLIALIQDDTKLPKHIIEKVLGSFKDLETKYLKGRQ